MDPPKSKSAKKPAVKKPAAKKTGDAKKPAATKKPTAVKVEPVPKADVAPKEEPVETKPDESNAEPEVVVESTKETTKEAAQSKARAKKISPVDIAVAKYTENGWTVVKPPRGSVNDFIANRAGRLHFVQVVTKETYEDPKYHGGAKNDFVQNAMSNSAIPVFAHVVGGSKPKVTFQDVNTNNRVIVSQRATKVPDEKK